MREIMPLSVRSRVTADGGRQIHLDVRVNERPREKQSRAATWRFTLSRSVSRFLAFLLLPSYFKPAIDAARNPRKNPRRGRRIVLTVIRAVAIRSSALCPPISTHVSVRGGMHALYLTARGE